jgi:hypothetical protein
MTTGVDVINSSDSGAEVMLATPRLVETPAEAAVRR